MTTSEFKWQPDDIAAALSAERPYDVVFERGDDISIELFAPVGEDTQQPHSRDEVYVVISGSGRFRRGGETITFEPGDLLFVPAHMPHRFERFSDDFRTWVIFFGPERDA